MKTMIKLLSGIMAAFCCSVGSAQIIFSNPAQIIYSNNFSASSSTASVNGTPPTVANNILGGSSSATWIVTFTNTVSATNSLLAGTVLQNGAITTNGGCALLPITPQSGAIYYITASFTVPSSMGNWAAIGFSQGAPQTNNIGYSRFTDAGNHPVNGYAWMDPRVASSENLFAGPGTGTQAGSGNLLPATGTYTLEIILNTFGTNWGLNTRTNWIASAFVNGTIMGTTTVGGSQLGTNIVYANNPPIGFAGIGQNTIGTGAINGVQWNYWALSTPLSPQISQEPASTSANQGAAFTNIVSAIADTNGGALFYQWFTNNVPVGGATNASLIINPVTAGSAGTNYFVVVTNTYGAVTSSPASLIVYTSPVLSNLLPTTYTNLFTLYAGANPGFSLSATGTSPLTYKWFTNGVLDAADATNTLQLTNVQAGVVSNYCIVTNLYGSATSLVWMAQVIPDPTNSNGGLAAYPQSVLALNPIGYWRMDDTNEDGPDNTVGDNGYICHDYVGGNDGMYSNAVLGNIGYNPTEDPSDTSAQFGDDPNYNNNNNDAGDEQANYIEGINFGSPSGTSAAFTVAAWVSGTASEEASAGIVSLGWGGGGEQFNLDCGAANSAFRFFMRDALGNTHLINSTVVANTTVSPAFGPWYYLVGVVDEINSQTVSFYINGQLVGTASVSTGSGVLASSYPMCIGARSSAINMNNNYQFTGSINDVSVFNYALSASQVAAQYVAGAGTIPPAFIAPLPPTNVVVTATNTTLTIPAAAFGQPPIGYYWTDVTSNIVLASGATNIAAVLNATLNTAVTTNWWGNELELVVTNSVGSTNLFVAVSPPLPPPVTIGYTNSLLYSNSFDGGGVTIGGTAATEVNMLVGGTNSVWICTYTNNAGASNGTVYASGVLGTNNGCVLVPFTPEPGYIYTMAGQLTESASMGNWVAMGFTEYDTQTNNATGNYSRFTDNPPNGYAWMYLENASAVFEAGPRTSGGGGSINTLSTAFPVVNTLQLVLNTITNNGWVATASADGVGIYTNVYSSNLPIAFAGIGQNAAPGSAQWNYWTLSAQPVSVAPYLLPPLPPTSIVATNYLPLTISATAYGMGPFGYYWTDVNAGTNLAAGATNATAPLNVTLNVPSVPASWNNDQLELTLTNAYGTNTTTVTLSVVSYNLGPIPVPIMSNDTLILSWPTNQIGLQLQAQTNATGVGIGANWANYNPSTGTNRVVIPINLTNGTVFFRLAY